MDLEHVRFVLRLYIIKKGYKNITYIKPPTQKEKEEYWTTAKEVTLIFIYIIIGIATIGTLGYLFYKYTHTMLYWTLISLVFIAIALFTLLISTIFATSYSQLYTSWHMIHKRHRIGYYSSFMNSLISSILVTIVIIIVVFCTYYDIFTNAFKMQDNNMFTIGQKIAVAISIIFIIVTTIDSILDIRKEKPSIPPVTEQEHKDREDLKELFYHVIKRKGLHSIDRENQSCGLNYLGTLDYYINYDVYDPEQVQNWRYNSYHDNINIHQIFIEMSELNKKKATEVYEDVHEKAKRKIEKLNKYYDRTFRDFELTPQIKSKLNEYLD